MWICVSVFEKKVALTTLTCNQVKTQQGVPSQPSRLEAVEVGSTTIRLRYNMQLFSRWLDSGTSSSLIGRGWQHHHQAQVAALLSLVRL